MSVRRHARGHVLVRLLWRVWVDHDDMALFKVIYEGVHVVQVHAAAGVVSTLRDMLAIGFAEMICDYSPAPPDAESRLAHS